MGFWSSLIGGVASFIPVVGPAIGGLISSLGGSGQSGNTGVNQQAQQSVQLPTMAPASGASTAENYYRSALQGNQATTESMLSPEVSTVLGQYDNAAKTAANLGPRGGGRTATLAEAPFKKAGAYGQALAGVQGGAGKSLADISLQEQQQKNQYAEAQGNLNLGQNKIQFEGQQAANKQAAGVGGGIADILTNIINKPKTSGGSSPSGSGSTGGSVFSSAMDNAMGLGGQGSTSSFDE